MFKRIPVYCQRVGAANYSTNFLAAGTGSLAGWVCLLSLPDIEPVASPVLLGDGHNAGSVDGSGSLGYWACYWLRFY